MIATLTVRASTKQNNPLLWIERGDKLTSVIAPHSTDWTPRIKIWQAGIDLAKVCGICLEDKHHEETKHTLEWCLCCKAGHPTKAS